MKVANVLVALLGLVACSLARSTYYDDLVWDSYKLDFDKVYGDELEERLRRQIFQDNKDAIDVHNQRWLAVRVNWTQMGAVTPVANQGHFNNSWAFAAAGVVESRQFVKNGKLVVLSKQNLIDCCKARHHLIASALRCIKRMTGIDTEASYPYRGLAGRCRFNKRTVGAAIKKAFQVLPGNETTLALSVAKGPVAAVISLTPIMSYKGGVFHHPHCGNSPNFAVLIVGYGTCKNFGDFWILKTPLGANWGEKGYMRLARNKKNLCGITNRAYYPVL